MAYDYFSEEENKQGDANQGGEQQLGSSGATITGNAPASGGPGGGKASSSGQFTNLQSYLNANADQNFGGQVAGRVQDSVDKANQAQQDTGNQFRQQVDQNTVKTDNDLLSKTSSNPNAIVSNQNQLAAYQKMRDAQYQGPKNLTENSDLYSQANNATSRASDTANATKTNEGRAAYLQQEYGKGRNYTSGQNKLDNLLISQDPRSKQEFAQVQQNAAQSANQFGTLQSSLDQYAQQGAAQTAATRAATRAALGIDDNGAVNAFGQDTGNGAIQSEVNSLDQQAKGAAASQAAEFQKYQQGLNGKMSDDDLARFGLKNGEQYWNLDPTQFLTQEQAPDRNSIADNTERAKLSALAKLAGTDQSWVNEQAPIYDPSKAVGFNTQEFENKANAQAAAYKDAGNNLKFGMVDTGYARTPAITNQTVSDILGGSDTDPVKLQKLQDFSAHSNQSDDPRLQSTIQGYINDPMYSNDVKVKARAIQDLLDKVYGAGNTFGGVKGKAQLAPPPGKRGPL